MVFFMISDTCNTFFVNMYKIYFFPFFSEMGVVEVKAVKFVLRSQFASQMLKFHLSSVARAERD